MSPVSKPGKLEITDMNCHQLVKTALKTIAPKIHIPGEVAIRKEPVKIAPCWKTER